jgi:hypothetical protein
MVAGPVLTVLAVLSVQGKEADRADADAEREASEVPFFDEEA